MKNDRSYLEISVKHLILFSYDKGIKNKSLMEGSNMKSNYCTPDLSIVYLQKSDIVTASALEDPTQDDGYGLFFKGVIE